MKKRLPIVFVVLFLSCNQFQTKKVSSEEILTQERNELNWNDVDQYPAFEECREILEQEKAKACFENKVTSFIYARLEAKKPVVTEAIHDTLWLELIVSEKGTPSVKMVEIDSVVIRQLPKIKSWIRESINSLPKIYPANKRGIPVATKFRMPLIIKAE